MDYRRSADRVAASLPAVMDLGEGLSTCLVTDLSHRGARLRVSPTKPLPQNFALRLSRSGTTHMVELRWRRDDEAGVEFRSPIQ